MDKLELLRDVGSGVITVDNETFRLDNTGEGFVLSGDHVVYCGAMREHLVRIREHEVFYEDIHNCVYSVMAIDVYSYLAGRKTPPPQEPDPVPEWTAEIVVKCAVSSYLTSGHYRENQKCSRRLLDPGPCAPHAETVPS